ncbi:universal stress protein [Pseudonocardia acidicola]|uniref:Universal stress protein n=1 Tax=Pseudonocardia acidicola TaxID=2724939 RepID=A0ABX1SEL0_9PSEU|nr:universal stress protein [Pseudonocardia acidicola]NMH99317.1 universal stress protein [Pseudonocardia acidicola]
MDASTPTPGPPDRRPVVVGVDESDSARDAAEWAGDLASLWQVPLRLVHTVLGEPDAPPISTVPDWLRELVDAAERCGVTGAGAEVVSGSAIEQLVERSVSARLLVVGSYGDGAWSGMLAGPTALALVGRAACPVAIVRGTSPQVPPPRGGPILVGVDGSAAGDAALEFAADLAAAEGARLLALHTWADVVADAAGGVRRLPVDWDTLGARGAELLAAHLKPVRERHPGLAVESEVVGDSPLRALIDRCRAARLAVVGHRGSAEGSGMLLGSTSRALVEFAACPVIVTKSDFAAAADVRGAATGSTATESSGVG